MDVAFRCSDHRVEVLGPQPQLHEPLGRRHPYFGDIALAEHDPLGPGGCLEEIVLRFGLGLDDRELAGSVPYMLQMVQDLVLGCLHGLRRVRRHIPCSPSHAPVIDLTPIKRGAPVAPTLYFCIEPTWMRDNSGGEATIVPDAARYDVIA